MAHLRYRWSHAGQPSDEWKRQAYMPCTQSADQPERAEATDRADDPNNDSADGHSPGSGDTGAAGAAYLDDRIERFVTPQYQTDEDAAAARASHDGEHCLVCAGIDY